MERTSIALAAAPGGSGALYWLGATVSAYDDAMREIRETVGTEGRITSYALHIFSMGRLTNEEFARVCQDGLDDYRTHHPIQTSGRKDAP